MASTVPPEQMSQPFFPRAFSGFGPFFALAHAPTAHARSAKVTERVIAAASSRRRRGGPARSSLVVSRARPADAASSSHGRSLFRFSAAPTRVRFFILCPEVFFLCLVKSRLARDGFSRASSNKLERARAARFTATRRFGNSTLASVLQTASSRREREWPLRLRAAVQLPRRKTRALVIL